MKKIEINRFRVTFFNLYSNSVPLFNQIKDLNHKYSEKRPIKKVNILI